MLVRLQLLGDGTDDDRYHVDMPNVSVVAVNYGNMSADVAIGVRDQPPHLPTKGSPLYPLEGDHYILIGLDQQGLSDWWAVMAKRYPGRDVNYMPDFP